MTRWQGEAAAEPSDGQRLRVPQHKPNPDRSMSVFGGHMVAAVRMVRCATIAIHGRARAKATYDVSPTSVAAQAAQ
jgi:hypothetical protein